MLKSKAIVKSIQFVMGDDAYALVVTFSRRRSITLRLEPGDDRIFIKAPIGINENELLLLIAKKHRWIKKRIADLASIQTTKREFTDGSTHLFLGESITLKVVEGKTNTAFEDNILTITARKTDPKNIERLLYTWYAKQAHELFPKIAASLISDFLLHHKVMASHFEYKRVKSYWGQCVGQRYIRINIELVRARPSSIKMIFAHELCHLVQPNHSKRFYALLDKHHPDWQADIKYLKENISLKY